MRETLEREIKLAPGEGFVLPELGGERLPTRIFVSTYHDTPELRLARHGVTFRHRVEDGAGVWQLKLPRGSARLELELPGTPARPPGEMIALLAAYLRGRELVPVARLRTRREGVRARGAEIVDDNVAVLEGQRVARRFREVEVELLEGDERTLRLLEKELRRAGADGSGQLQPKLYRALDLAGPIERSDIPEGTPPAEALALALDDQYRQLLIHDPGVRRGDDIESLHQLRVATRRLRAFLRAARPLLKRTGPSRCAPSSAGSAGVLGPARDLDVMLERLRPRWRRSTGTPHPRRVCSVRSKPIGPEPTPMSRLRSAATATSRCSIGSRRPPLHRDSRASTRAEDDLAPAGEANATRVPSTRRRPRGRRAARVENRRQAGAVCRRAGRARARPFGCAVCGPRQDLQDVLGEHQDAVVAEERIRDWVAAAPSGAFAAGRLVQLEVARRADARALWPHAWSRLDRAARKAAS